MRHKKFNRVFALITLITFLILSSANIWAKGTQSKRSKRQAVGMGADESVAQQVNDPTSFLREARIDTSIEHGKGEKHTTVEWTPAVAFPLSQRFRFESGIPVLMNGPGDRDDFELSDIYASLAYIFYHSENLNALADFRIDLPTGNENRKAGSGVTQWHATIGSVIYTFDDQDLLILPFIEYRQSIFAGAGSPKVSILIGSVGLVYLLSQNSYIRSDWTVNFDERDGWKDSALLNIEVGRIFMDRYSIALGYEFDLWGDAEIRNAATLSLGYLF